MDEHATTVARRMTWQRWLARMRPVIADVEPDDDTPPPQPPDAATVGRRAAILAAVMERGFIERYDGAAPAPAASITEWVSATGLLEDCEPDERALLVAPAGALDEQAVADATWRSEGLAVLTWALGRIDEVPPFYAQIDPDVLGAALAGFPWESSREVEEFLADPGKLRPAEELEELYLRLLAAHWRVRDFEQIDPSPMDFVAFVPTVQWAPLTVDGLSIVDRDLAIGDVAIGEADPAAVRNAHSILLERRLAISWLLDAGVPYSEGDTNT